LAGSSVRGPSAGKDRWFTLAAATALALGIGANAAVFTFVNAVLLRGLPFDNPDRIVSLGVMNARGQRNGVSYREFTDWREQTQTWRWWPAWLAAISTSAVFEQFEEHLRGINTIQSSTLTTNVPLLGGFVRSLESKDTHRSRGTPNRW
jgi:hypothetical protein